MHLLLDVTEFARGGARLVRVQEGKAARDVQRNGAPLHVPAQ